MSTSELSQKLASRPRKYAHSSFSTLAQSLLAKDTLLRTYYSAVHHNCFGLMLAQLKTFPFKGSHHCCNAASVVVDIADKFSSYVNVRTWVPNSSCIFQLGPDKCLVASLFDMLRT